MYVFHILNQELQQYCYLNQNIKQYIYIYIYYLIHCKIKSFPSPNTNKNHSNEKINKMNMNSVLLGNHCSQVYLFILVRLASMVFAKRMAVSSVSPAILHRPVNVIKTL